MIYLRLFFEFFKTGLFAVGGGLATFPFLRDMAAKYPTWFTEGDLLDMIAISESTPGPIGVNMATYAGYNAAGVLGSVSATLGLVAPAIIVVLLVAGVLEKFQKNHYVNAAFYGLRPAVTGLIAAAGLTVAKQSLLVLPLSGSLLSWIHVPSVVIFAVVFICLKVFKKHPIVYLLASALVGILLGLF